MGANRIVRPLLHVSRDTLRPWRAGGRVGTAWSKPSAQLHSNHRDLQEGLGELSSHPAPPWACTCWLTVLFQWGVPLE